ncbi:MAG TPA: hypothetical protein PKA05_23990, partial [Roseiflexaceae bacterium]|nr:hypothetical protein [Roseiflexaceae bacterium]
GYAWNYTAPAWIDCDAFQQQLGDLRDDTLASMAVEQALDLYQGDFLEEVGCPVGAGRSRSATRSVFAGYRAGGAAAAGSG